MQRFDIYCRTCGALFRRKYPCNPDTLRPYDCPSWQRADRNAPTMPIRIGNRRHETTCLDPFEARVLALREGSAR